MSTTKTEKTDDTAKATEDQKSENKAVFGPLGKYAIVAVIMVSIIVTTAIMLNKQLGSVEEQLAVMENEVAEEMDKVAISTDTVASETVEATTETQETAVVTDTTPVEVQVVEVQVAEVQATEIQAVEAPSAEVAVATKSTAENTVTEAATSTEQTSSTDTAVIKPATLMSQMSVDKDQFQLEMDQRDQERQARIDAYKLEQKQHMTEMFARIKTLESQRLDEYKASKDQQVERLREQIAKQEQLIEALILRNKEWIEMRAASMQRSQSNREKMLDRI